MTFELSRSFGFEAAHTLDRTMEITSSRTVHGHSYRAIVTLKCDALCDGMLVDLGILEEKLSSVRNDLDHKFLNAVPGLTRPTLEELCVWIWKRLACQLPQLHRVVVRRDSLDEQCSFSGPAR